MHEYASNVVWAFRQICETHDLPHPQLISESGRALTAHHAVLVTNVIGEERLGHIEPERRVEGDAHVAELWRVYDRLEGMREPRDLVEAYHDVVQAVGELQDRFVLGLTLYMLTLLFSMCVISLHRRGRGFIGDGGFTRN